MCLYRGDPLTSLVSGGTVCKQTNLLSKEQEIEAQILAFLMPIQQLEELSSSPKDAERGCQEQDFPGIYLSKAEKVQRRRRPSDQARGKIHRHSAPCPPT